MGSLSFRFCAIPLLFAFMQLFLLSHAAMAQQTTPILYEPAPDWVIDAPIPEQPSAATAGSGAGIRLISQQIFVGEKGSGMRFSRTVSQAESEAVLQTLGSINVSYSEGREQLIVHHLRLLRGTETIDLLAGVEKFRQFRTEQMAQQGMLFGTVSANFLVPGLRVGDKIDVAVSRRSINPFMGDNYEDFADFGRGVRADRIHMRLTWHKRRTVKWYSGQKLARLDLSKSGEFNIAEGAIDNVRIEPMGFRAPTRLLREQMLQASTFADYLAIADWYGGKFEIAVKLDGDAELAGRIDAIIAQHADPLARATAALALVQNEIRYTGNFEGLGNYQPDPALTVWRNRYGDCKGKTALLTAILRKMGISAVPALVSVKRNSGIETALPSMGNFDHVIVKAEIGGKSYWLDGTRKGDKDLNAMEPPFFRFALPLKADGALEPLPPAQYLKPTRTEIIEIDASAGFDEPARITKTIVRRDLEAAQFDAMRSRMTKADEAKQLEDQKAAAAKRNVTLEAIEHIPAGENGESTYRTVELRRAGWNNAGDIRELYVKDLQPSSFGPFSDLPLPFELPGFMPSFNQDETQPVQVAPRYSESQFTIKLPVHNGGYTLTGRSFDRQIGPIRITRTLSLKNNVFSGKLVTLARGEEVSAEAAKKFDLDMASFDQDKVYVTAENMIRQAAAQSRSTLNEAAELVSKGEIDAALQLLKDATRSGEGLAPLYFARAMILIEHKRKGAERELQQALLAEPMHAGALQWSAILAANEGDLELADAFVAKLRKANPAHAWLRRWPALRTELEAQQKTKDTAPVPQS